MQGRPLSDAFLDLELEDTAALPGAAGASPPPLPLGKVLKQAQEDVYKFLVGLAWAPCGERKRARLG